MTTGTGIFLGSIIIGLVMLYGQTKDRWKWPRIWKIVGLVVVLILAFGGITIYHTINGWDNWWDWSLENNLAVFLCLIIGFFLASLFYKPYTWVMEKQTLRYSNNPDDWEFSEDEEGTLIDSKAYKIRHFIMLLLFWSPIFFHDYLKPIVSGWIN